MTTASSVWHPAAGTGAMAHLVRDALGGPVENKVHIHALAAAAADGVSCVADAAAIAHLAHTLAQVADERGAAIEITAEVEFLRARAVSLHQQLFELALTLQQTIERSFARGVLPMTLELLERRATLGCHHKGMRQASENSLQQLGVGSLSELPPERWREAFACLCEAQSGMDPGTIFSVSDISGVWVDPSSARNALREATI